MNKILTVLAKHLLARDEFYAKIDQNTVLITTPKDRILYHLDTVAVDTDLLQRIRDQRTVFLFIDQSELVAMTTMQVIIYLEGILARYPITSLTCSDRTVYVFYRTEFGTCQVKIDR